MPLLNMSNSRIGPARLIFVDFLLKAQINEKKAGVKAGHKAGVKAGHKAGVKAGHKSLKKIAPKGYIYSVLIERICVIDFLMFFKK